jgi:hypothetical protein
MKAKDVSKIGPLGRGLLGLSARKKLTILAILLLLSTLCAAATIWLGKRLVVGFVEVNEARGKQSMWLEKESSIEADVIKFSQLNKFENIDLLHLKSAVETIAAEANIEYSIENLNRRQIGNFVISRLRVNFTDIPLANLVDFFGKIESLGNNVAIVEGKIDAMNGDPLNAYCVISILDWV